MTPPSVYVVHYIWVRVPYGTETLCSEGFDSDTQVAGVTQMTPYLDKCPTAGTDNLVVFHVVVALW